MKTKERELARSLRSEDGCSIKEIARRLGVSRASVSVWVRDVVLTDDQRARLERRARNGYLTVAAASRDAARRRREGYQEDGRRLARTAGTEYACGCMLFWAEGSRARNSAQLVNSDPALVRFWIDFLRRYFDVESRRIRLVCNLFADHEDIRRDIERFWLSTLGLPDESLLTSMVNRYSRVSNRKRLNKLPYGTAKVTVHDTRIVQMLYGSIQELAGFERPEWLDL